MTSAVPAAPQRTPAARAPGISQCLHQDVASVEQPRQPRLGSAPSPYLADHSGRYDHTSVVLTCHLDHRCSFAVTFAPPRSVLLRPGPSSTLFGQCQPLAGAGQFLLGRWAARIVEQFGQDTGEVLALQPRPPGVVQPGAERLRFPFSNISASPLPRPLGRGSPLPWLRSYFYLTASQSSKWRRRGVPGSSGEKRPYLSMIRRGACRPTSSSAPTISGRPSPQACVR